MLQGAYWSTVGTYDSTVAKLVRDWLAGGELLNRCSLHELHIQVLTRHNRTESSLQPVGLSK